MSPAQSHGPHQKWTVNLPSASIGRDRTRVTLGENEVLIFMVVLISAIVLAVTGWVYALGWVALKLI
jgi:hypothetical protein